MRRDEKSTASLWVGVLQDLDPDMDAITLLTDRVGAVAHEQWGTGEGDDVMAWAFRDGSVLEHREEGGAGWVEGESVGSVATTDQVVRALRDRARAAQVDAENVLRDAAADHRSWARGLGL